MTLKAIAPMLALLLLLGGWASPALAQSQASKYKMLTGPRVSNPESARLYKMSQIMDRRGRAEIAARFRGNLLAKYPDSLEALYIQIQNMTVDTVRLTQAGKFNQSLYAAINSVPDAYRKLPAYARLDAEKMKWLNTMVLLRTGEKSFDESFFEFLKKIPPETWNTDTHLELKTRVFDWMVALGDQEIKKRDNPETAKDYYAKAGQFPIDDNKKKWLANRVRTEQIRLSIRQGKKDDAEMALVVWETEEPKSTLVKQLWKELDLPAGMVTIPAGDVKGTPVNSFNLDIYETTNLEFLVFVKAKPSFRKSKMDEARNDEDYLRRWSGDLEFSGKYANIPVVFVSQIVATAYCQWRKKRLPSSLEWGLAAGEGKRKYPWGDNEPDEKIANFNKGLFGDPMPGNSHPLGATPEGVMHMAGNVWEPTSNLREDGKGLGRGGSYQNQPRYISNDYRGRLSYDPINYSSRFLGIRCAK